MSYEDIEGVTEERLKLREHILHEISWVQNQSHKHHPHTVFMPLSLPPLSFEISQNAKHDLMCNFSFGGKQDARFSPIVSPNTNPPS
jgi:hypothetical protein